MSGLLDLGSELHWLGKGALRLSRVLVWVVTTPLLGAIALIEVVRLVRRLPRLLAAELPCRRGHVVARYGVYSCACGAPIEGYVFARCAICGLSAGWTPCPECGLPVRNPRLP
jgi:hypothetical protein